MRIVVLDDVTLNPGDNGWGDFSGLGELVVYERTPPEQVLERAADADILVINKVRLSAALINALPRLRCICVVATGYDVVDTAAAAARGIPVCNVRAYGVESVAQQVMALLLELCRRVGEHDASIRRGDWGACPDFCYWLSPQVELAGLTMGIAGYGSIGRRVGELAHAFGMKVIAHSRSRSEPPAYAPFAFVSREELFREADVISLHCPLFPETREMVNRGTLALMKPGSLIINTARGGLVNENDVAEALRSGRLGGFGADVLSKEPAAPDNPLLHTPNTVLTPHIAWASLAARRTITRVTIANIRAFLAGKPQNVVNGVGES